MMSEKKKNIVVYQFSLLPDNINLVPQNTVYSQYNKYFTCISYLVSFTFNVCIPDIILGPVFVVQRPVVLGIEHWGPRKIETAASLCRPLLQNAITIVELNLKYSVSVRAFIQYILSTVSCFLLSIPPPSAPSLLFSIQY